ncbi:response regulator transcription factor [Aureitalea sp. L0-47]|uniref:response regulator n=1 Tax=Aureitalea sp. L0-47 TaxID=2816962 RepID=UPI00223813E5|nr:response regulator [Aureitalea sp. L0-47]MCW5521124.1 response regulator transcription factor [Aureitalea sp. L0-47]
MFKKVLISDDLDSINHGVQLVTESLGISEVTQVQYCDDAYLKIKKGIMDEAPYELLITDLSFKSDHRAQTYTSGEALIKILSREHPELRIIVYSIEDRPLKVRYFFENYKIDAFVCKSRKGMNELKDAIRQVYNGKLYLSPQIQNSLNKQSHLEIEEYDVELLRQLAAGKSQDEISHEFKQQAISPSSLSSIEKRLNKLRIQFKSNNAIQLVAVAKDLGII